jgi:MATE family multidrug resistance protein
VFIIIYFFSFLQLGMSSATETLCGQAFGAKQYHMMGIYLQRSWIVDAVTATIMLPLFIFTTPIFRLLGEEEEIAITSEEISLWFIPVFYSYVFVFTIQMYLQAQLKNSIIGWLSAASFLLHILLSWILVSILDFGVNGAMGAFNIASWLPIFGEFVYIFGGWCPNTWKGFTTAAFVDLWPIVKLSVSSGVMLW